MQKTMKVKLEQKKRRIATLLYYWNNIVNIYDKSVRDFPKIGKEKSQFYLDYIEINKIPE